VVEVASNDGYLLQHFIRAGIPALGIEPAANVARVAVSELSPPWSASSARSWLASWPRREAGRPHLRGNVLAQVSRPGIRAGLRVLLKPSGVITIEFPHLMRLMAETQFDTIYHEHFSYFSYIAAERIFAATISCCSMSRSFPPTEARCGSTRAIGPTQAKASPRGLGAAAAGDRYRVLTCRRIALRRAVKETKRKLLEF